MKDQAAERPPLNMRDTVATRIHTRSGSSVLGLQESTPEGRPLIERAPLVFRAPNPSLHFARVDQISRCATGERRIVCAHPS